MIVSPNYQNKFSCNIVLFVIKGTLETMNVVDKIAEDTIVFHQIHKRIWPTAQRDATFWSHLTHVPDEENKSDDSPHIWAVVNNSVELSSYPV